MKLLPKEQEAKDFVAKIGLERASRILSAITRRFDRRFKKACEVCVTPINPEWVPSTKLEISLTYRLKMGMQLLDTYNTPAAAKARIRARIQARNERLKQRRTELLANATA